MDNTLLTVFIAVTAAAVVLQAAILAGMFFAVRKTTAKVEVYNLLNSNGVLTENSNYGSFRGPTSIVQARFAKFGVQFDF